jgi:hypothetical protein
LEIRFKIADSSKTVLENGFVGFDQYSTAAHCDVVHRQSGGTGVNDLLSAKFSSDRPARFRTEFRQTP